MVVTAAHCGTFLGVTAHIGGNQCSGNDVTDSIPVSAERPRPNYDENKVKFDIILRKFQSPSLAPVTPWPTRLPGDGTKVKAIGYG